MRFKGAKIRWFGHSAFQILTPEGKSILIDPWFDNPSGSPGFIDEIEKVDIVLITHGHGDHLGNVVDIYRRFKPKIYAIFEISQYLAARGVESVGMNISGCVTDSKITICMTEAAHSSADIVDGRIVYLGNPAGFVITLENGFKIYHAGDTGLFGGLSIIGEFYKPDVVMLPIGGHFTMGPEEAAYAVKLLKPSYIIPMHYGTFPVLTGTPDELIEALDPEYKDRVVVMEVGVLTE